MNIYKLTAGNIVLDTNDIDVSITYEIDDILDISKRSTTWTRTITLPGSPINNKYFSQLFDVNVDATTFNLTKRVPITLSLGTNTLLNGYMQLLILIIKNVHMM